MTTNEAACMIHGVKPMQCVTIHSIEGLLFGFVVWATITELSGKKRLIPFIIDNAGKIYSPADWCGKLPKYNHQLAQFDWCEGFKGHAYTMTEDCMIRL